MFLGVEMASERFDEFNLCYCDWGKGAIAWMQSCRF